MGDIRIGVVDQSGGIAQPTSIKIQNLYSACPSTYRNRQHRNKTPVIDHFWNFARIALSADMRITLFTLTCYGGVGIIRRAAGSFSTRPNVGGKKWGRWGLDEFLLPA